MYAIIKTGGKQYKVQEGDELLSRRSPAKAAIGNLMSFLAVLQMRPNVGLLLTGRR